MLTLSVLYTTVSTKVVPQIRETVKAYATMSIGTMSGNSSAFLDCASRCLRKNETESLYTRVCVVSFYYAETLASFDQITVNHHYP